MVVHAVVASAAVPLHPSVAAAEDNIRLGGGAGIGVAGSYCTLTTDRHDSLRELVTFAAAHWDGPGAQVVAEGAAATADERLNYSVIRFDPARVTPIANFAGFAIIGTPIEAIVAIAGLRWGKNTGGNTSAAAVP